MTMKTNFLQPGSYNAIDLVNQFNAMFSGGVVNVKSGSLLVSALASPNMSLNVAPGAAMNAGLFLNNDSIFNVIITANVSSYNRIDIIAVDLSVNSIVDVMGTPSSSPTAPMLNGNQVQLNQVSVGSNVSVINTANLSDERNDFTVNSPLIITYGNGNGIGLFSCINAVYILWAWDKGSTNHLLATGYKGGAGTTQSLSINSNSGLTLGAGNSSGTQVISGIIATQCATMCIALPWNNLGL